MIFTPIPKLYIGFKGSTTHMQALREISLQVASDIRRILWKF